MMSQAGNARWLMLVLGLVLLAGCRQDSLYSNLSEQEANEMVAVLALSGIDASKQPQKANAFSVTTARDDFAQAVQVLKNTGLPRQRYDTLGEVFAKEGFVSSPLEERARLNHALSQEIASTLSSIDGVILARVHLAVPPKNDLNDTAAAASASVFVKHRHDVDLTDSVSRIKALVVNGIENLAYEDVTVALFETQDAAFPTDINVIPLPIQSVKASQMSLLPTGFDNVSVAALAVLLLLVLLVLAWAWRSRRT